MITSRAETTADIAAIPHVVEIAFGQTSEAGLVDALRQADALLSSLVGVEEGQIVGHVAFSALRSSPWIQGWTRLLWRRATDPPTSRHWEPTGIARYLGVQADAS